MADTSQITPEDFAKKIKAKYPQYASIPDGDLVKKIVAKYPQYSTQIKWPEAEQPKAGAMQRLWQGFTGQMGDILKGQFQSAKTGGSLNQPDSVPTVERPELTQAMESVGVTKEKWDSATPEQKKAMLAKTPGPTSLPTAVPAQTFNPLHPVETAGFLIPQPLKDLYHKLKGGDIMGAVGQGAALATQKPISGKGTVATMSKAAA